MIPGTRPRRRLPALLLLAAAALLQLLAAVQPASGSPATQSGRSTTADYLEVSGYLDAPAAGFLLRHLQKAQSDDAAVLLVRLDSPGALDSSLRPVLRAMVESRVPVVVWVAPGDARAGSASSLLALSAHRAVMSPDATIGPAHPLDLGRYDGSGDDGETRAVVEEAAGDRERDLADGAVDRLVSSPLSAAEAAESGVVDGTAATVQELLASLRGLSLEVAGEQVTLPEEPLTLRFLKMSLLERLAHSAIRPEFAYLLLLVGFFALIFELYNPGLGAGGVAGATALGFSLYAFTVLPVSWPAVAAIVLAVGLLSADLAAGRLGAVSILGGLLLLGGTVFLYAGSHPDIRLGWAAGIAGMLLTLFFFISVMTSAIRARTARPLPGAEGIVGAVGVARTDISPDGQVMARGTLWRARTLGAAIGGGTAVKIEGVSGLMLLVEPTNEAPEASDLEAAGAVEPADD